MRRISLPQCVLAAALLSISCVATADDAADAIAISGRVVDEAGSPVAESAVGCRNWRGVGAEVMTDAEGRFSVSLPDGTYRLVARNDIGDQLGYFALGYDVATADVEVVLKPARMIDVATSLDGQPVADVAVELHADGQNVAAGLTDADGHCLLTVPRDAIIHTIIAYRREVGFGGYMRDDFFYTLEEDNSPDEYTFELAPAGKIIARAQDRQGRPIAGITVYPTSVDWADERISMGATPSTHITTDEQGEAVFDFLPAEPRWISFSALVGEDLHLVSGASWRPGAGNIVTLEVWPKATVTGTVLNIDGTPAAGVSLELVGEGPQRSATRQSGVSDGQGRYEFRCPPDHAFMIGVDDPQLASQSAYGMVRIDEGTTEGPDVQLVQGTTFHGSVRLDDGTILNESSVTIIDNGELQQITYNGEQESVHPRLIRHVSLDSDGRFSIVLGPGSYQAQYQAGRVAEPAFFTFDVVDQAEISHDFVLKTIHEEQLRGVVVRDVDGTLEPVAGITVFGSPYNLRGPHQLTAVTDEQGEFEMTWRPGVTLLHVLSDDGAWGVTHLLQGQPEKLELVLLPTTTATGQVLDNGGAIPGFTFEYKIRVGFENSEFMSLYGGEVETDDEGRFTLEHLIQGQKYYGTHQVGSTGFHVLEVTAADASPIDLGQIEFARSERFPTPIEQMQNVFLGSEDAPRRLETALADAGFHRQHVLLFVGKTESDEVRDLFRLFFTAYDDWDPRGDSLLQPRLHDYELCGLTPAGIASAELDSQLIAAASSEMALVALDAQGSVLGALTADQFVAADATFDVTAIQEFLEAHRPPEVDVELLLEEALAAAAASDPPKPILVHEVDTLVGTSRRMSRWFANNADTLEPHLVYLPVDPVRMRQGHELLDALTGSDYFQDQYGQKLNITWVGLMRADGELINAIKLTNGRGLVTNGTDFVSELDVQIVNLIALITGYAPEIDSETLNMWRDSLLETEPYGND